MRTGRWERRQLAVVSALSPHAGSLNAKRSQSRFARMFTACAAAAAVLCMATAGAQDALTAARDLYRAAEYENALARLNSLHPSSANDTKFVEQYRALCLLALGRTAEAEKAIEAVVTSSPTFSPSETEQSPRIRAAFREVRQRVLPQIIQQMYADAKAAFDRRDSNVAATKFQQVLDLLNDVDIAPVASRPPLSEIGTLAVGFRDLAAKNAAQHATAALPAGVPAPREPSQPTQAAAVRASTVASIDPPIYSMQDANVVPAVPVRESWAALTDVFAIRTGVITVVINESGDVETVTMTVPVNPVYDRLAVATAKNWKYRPATMNGVAVKFRRVVLLDLKTTR